ncbi:hypothetical protein COB55_02150 [Candidatus Wolfebacteria bacterium]|nr:MAG: hypothetical protein COB55_02150 [Candidatus Wolfebacteria bacterium]
MITMDTDIKKQFFGIVLLLIAIAILSVLPMYVKDADPVIDEIEEIATAQIEEIEAVDPFSEITIVAKSAYVYDLLKEEVLYAKNEEIQMPLASVTKLMTALVANELVPEYNTVVISHDAISQEGDSGFYMNEKWRVKDLIDYMLISSSNDGARALASVASAFSTTTLPTDGVTRSDQFVDRMNARAIELGLVQTYFLNESGLDINGSTAGAYGSSRDMAILLGYVVDNYPHLLEATKYENLSVESLQDLSHSVLNTNVAVARIPGLIGSKTGYTELAGGNLVIAFDAGIGHPIVVSVLGSTIEDRFIDIDNLVWATIEQFGQIQN